MDKMKPNFIFKAYGMRCRLKPLYKIDDPDLRRKQAVWAMSEWVNPHNPLELREFFQNYLFRIMPPLEVKGFIVNG